MTALPLLTASRLKDARACARLDYYKYQLGYRPATAEDSEALTLGTLVHKGLEAWWLTFDLVEAIGAVRAANAEPFAAARAEAMLAGYHVQWFGSAAAYAVIAVEAEFRAPLINPETAAASRTFGLGGKLDVLVREKATGRVLIIEHKTSGEDITPGSLYRRRLRMDGQVSMYFRGAFALGHSASGCLYDVLGKHRQRPKAGETAAAFRDRLVEVTATQPDTYYARFEVTRDSDELAEADADAWAMAGLLRENARTGRHPRNVDACSRYGRCCDFIAVCEGAASLDDGFARLANPHPELEAVCPSLPPA